MRGAAAFALEIAGSLTVADLAGWASIGVELAATLGWAIAGESLLAAIDDVYPPLAERMGRGRHDEERPLVPPMTRMLRA